MRFSFLLLSHFRFWVLTCTLSAARSSDCRSSRTATRAKIAVIYQGCAILETPSYLCLTLYCCVSSLTLATGPQAPTWQQVESSQKEVNRHTRPRMGEGNHRCPWVGNESHQISPPIPA